MMATAAAVRERPILFSGPMVRAILEGSKTQTRRVVTGEPLRWLAPDMFWPEYVALPENGLSPYGFAGDRLWVRETFAAPGGGISIVAYLADGECGAWIGDGDGGRVWLRHGGVVDKRVPLRDESWRGDSFGLGRFGGRWKPSIHMPRWACRIVLELTDVRVERLQAITEDDARAEGITEDFPAIECNSDRPFAEGFRHLWDSINAKRGFGWDANPWVWVLSFKRVTD